MKNCQGCLVDEEVVVGARESERPVFSHEEYINLVLRSGPVMTHDYSGDETKKYYFEKYTSL